MYVRFCSYGIGRRGYRSDRILFLVIEFVGIFLCVCSNGLVSLDVCYAIYDLRCYAMRLHSAHHAELKTARIALDGHAVRRRIIERQDVSD